MLEGGQVANIAVGKLSSLSIRGALCTVRLNTNDSSHMSIHLASHGQMLKTLYHDMSKLKTFTDLSYAPTAKEGNLCEGRRGYKKRNKSSDSKGRHRSPVSELPWNLQMPNRETPCLFFLHYLPQIYLPMTIFVYNGSFNW